MPLDGRLEGAILEYAAVPLVLLRGGCKVFPEERVVDVACKSIRDKIEDSQRSDRRSAARKMKFYVPPPLNFRAA